MVFQKLSRKILGGRALTQNRKFFKNQYCPHIAIKRNGPHHFIISILLVYTSDINKWRAINIENPCCFVSQNSGIEKIVPGSVNDGCLFHPIGFSLNGLNKDCYYTIHVTPQASCSYVSFETNIKRKDYSQIINQVVEIFKPNKFIITLFSAKVFLSSYFTSLLSLISPIFFCQLKLHLFFNFLSVEHSVQT